MMVPDSSDSNNPQANSNSGNRANGQIPLDPSSSSFSSSSSSSSTANPHGGSDQELKNPETSNVLDQNKVSDSLPNETGSIGSLVASSTGRDRGNLARLRSSAFLENMDIFLGGLVVIFAFLISSFAAKNNDIWQHLAVGKLLAEGNYSFTQEPFSLNTSGEPWINHSWLSDLLLYQIYSKISPAATVVVKALLIALLAVVLILTKPNRQTLWASCCAVIFFLLASSPRFLLQTTIVSMLLMGITLWLCENETLLKNPKRFLLLIGLLHLFWVNLDQWFILGPMILFLYWVNGYLLSPQEILASWRDQGSEASKASRSRSANPYLYPLLIAIAATFLNPYFHRAWVFPIEIFGGEIATVAKEDPELRSFFTGIFNAHILRFDNNVYSPAIAIGIYALFLYGLVSFVFNILRFRWVHLALWILLGLSVLINLRMMPFFGIVSVAIGNYNIGQFLRYLGDKQFTAQELSLLGLGRSLGRTASLATVILLILACRPGWLNIFYDNPRLARWMVWECKPDPAIAEPLQELQKMHESGLIPPGSRALFLHTNPAMYAAWFCPAEKTFFDYRFAVHRHSIVDFIELRKAFNGSANPPENILPLLEKYQITHLILGSENPLENEDLMNRISFTSRSLLGQGWTPWLVRGRLWVLGRNNCTNLTAEQKKALTFDPIKTFLDE